jgi:hypothetical protein
MRRRLILISFCLVGCSTGEENLSSDTFSSLDGEDNETTGDGDPGDGDGDSGDGDGDGDGDSGDGDGDPGDGDPGDGDGDSGDGDGDPGLCDRHLYMHDLSDNSWETQPLDLVWVGPNAPPCSVEPMGTAYLEVWDQLLVWGANGMYYRRIGGTWQPPEPIANRWAILAEIEIDSVSYTPPLEGSNSADLIFSALPNAFIYRVFEDGATSYDQSVMIMDEPPPGPAQSSLVRTWSLELADPSMLGQVNWYTLWSGYDDGKIYRADASFNWTNWPANQAPLLSGAPGGLDPSALEAGWGNYALNRAYLVGP